MSIGNTTTETSSGSYTGQTVGHVDQGATNALSNAASVSNNGAIGLTGAAVGLTGDSATASVNATGAGASVS